MMIKCAVTDHVGAIIVILQNNKATCAHKVPSTTRLILAAVNKFFSRCGRVTEKLRFSFGSSYQPLLGPLRFDKQPSEEFYSHLFVVQRSAKELIQMNTVLRMLNIKV